jgi:hypothetical protein
MGWTRFAGGLILTFFGLITLIGDGYTRYGIQVSVSRIVSIGIIVYGLIMLRSGYHIVTSESTKSKRGKYLKCVNCGKIDHSSSMPNEICPQCSGKLENLEGFFDRHPNQKIENNGKTD